MVLTEEQKEIVFSKKNSISVVSVAGSGKTTTLIEYAKENFEKSILCIMFSKDLRKITKQKMPINCEVHTINSLSFKYSKYKNNIIIENIGVIDIMNMLNINDIDKSFDILNDYISFTNSFETTWTGSGYEIYELLKSGKYKIDHSFILKEFSMSKEISLLDYDIIMVDEAQDTNPVMLDIIKKIKHKKEIFVEDPKQAIYGFRQNISILDNIKTEVKFTLSKSFRFGTEISNYVNNLNDIIYGPGQAEKIYGNEKINSIITEDSLFGLYSAYITRTNAHLFEKAIEYALLGFNICIPFDWVELKESLYNMLYLKLGMRNKINNKLILKYKSYELFKNSIKRGYNVELSYLISIVDKYDIAIIEYINLLEKHLSSSRYADISLITAHKAKGLEFLFVELGSDFKLTNIEERNLIYVAATRGVKEMNAVNIEKLLKKSFS